MIYPKTIDHKIGVTAPSEGTRNEVDARRLQMAIQNWNQHQFEVVTTPNCDTSELGRSTTAKKRAKEFEQLLQDDTIEMICCLAGGDFLLEMLSELDFDLIKQHPKWIQGYSDPTGILFTVTTSLDIATIYGANFKTFAMKEWHPSLKNNLELLKGNGIVQHSFDAYEETSIKYIVGDEPYHIDTPVLWKNLDGSRRSHLHGRLIGGCLDLLISLVGTRFDQTASFLRRYQKDGIVWYFDSCELSSEQVLRGLWQLKEAGWFQYTTGIIFGRSYTDTSTYGVPFRDAVATALGEFNVPIVLDADFGHKPPQITLINGAMVDIVCENGKGTVSFQLE